MKVQPRTVDAIEYPMLDVDTKIINGHPEAGEYGYQMLLTTNS